VKEPSTIVTEFNGQVATLWLAKPEVHNALDDIMIRELSTFFKKIEENNEIRLVIIRGRGRSFCSGADLNWMKRAFGLTKEENLRECQDLSDLFKVIYESSKVVISVVHGNVFGGGNGIVAACDLAYCIDSAKFSLSETRIGMAAASITPYMLRKVHASDLKALIFSAMSFNGKDAVKYGLVNKSFPSPEFMELYLDSIISEMLANGKLAVFESKRLINRLTDQSVTEEKLQIPELLARIRVSPEAQEGFSAFLEKRKPRW
jgi:methylglutaconyl-CoA hydratase